MQVPLVAVVEQVHPAPAMEDMASPCGNVSVTVTTPVDGRAAVLTVTV